MWMGKTAKSNLGQTRPEENYIFQFLDELLLNKNFKDFVTLTGICLTIIDGFHRSQLSQVNHMDFGSNSQYDKWFFSCQILFYDATRSEKCHLNI